MSGVLFERGVRRRGFTLVELLIAVTAGSLILGIATIMISQTQRLTERSNSESSANLHASALISALRADLARLDGTQFMVIRLADIALESNGERVVHAADQIMFFRTGSSETASQSPVNSRAYFDDFGSAPVRRDVWLSERPDEVPVVNLSTGILTLEPLRTAGATSRVWYGHLATPSLREWSSQDFLIGNWPSTRWGLGRHELVLAGNGPTGWKKSILDSGLRRPSADDAPPDEPARIEVFAQDLQQLFGRADSGLGYALGGPIAVQLSQNLALLASELFALPVTSIGEIGRVDRRSAMNWPNLVSEYAVFGGTADTTEELDVWLPGVAAPALWDQFKVRGRVWLSPEERDDLAAGRDVEPLFPPADLAMTTSADIRAFLLPLGLDAEFDPLNGTDIDPAEQTARLSDHYTLMHESCYRIEGTNEWGLEFRGMLNGDSLPNAAQRDGTWGADDEATVLGNTMVPYCSSFRVQWAGDYVNNATGANGGDGLLDRFTAPVVNGLGLSSIDTDADGINDRVDLNADGLGDVPVGSVVWYGMATEVHGLARGLLPSPAPGIFDQGIVTSDPDGNGRVDTAADAAAFAGAGKMLMRDIGTDSPGIAEGDFYDIAFGYPTVSGIAAPWMLRFTLTLRDKSGQLIGSPVRTQRGLLTETLGGNQSVGSDVEASSIQFIIELPRGG